MHKFRAIRPWRQGAVMVLGIAIIAGCKPSTEKTQIGSDRNEPEWLHTDLKGTVKLEDKPVVNGYLIFEAIRGAPDQPGDKDKFGSEPLPNYYRFGWGKIGRGDKDAKAGEYTAMHVPIGRLRVTLYTDPNDFERELKACQSKATMGLPHKDQSSQQDSGGPPRSGGPQVTGGDQGRPGEGRRPPRPSGV